MRFLYAIFSAGVLATAAVADVPLPPTMRYIDPQVCFQGIEKYPEHVFFLKFLTFTGGPGNTAPTIIPVTNSKPFKMGAQRRLIEMQLLAVDRKTYELHASVAEPGQLLHKTPGVLSVPLEAPSTVSSRFLPVPVTTYRISINDGKLMVSSGDSKRSDLTPDGRTAVPMGVVSALALAWLGIRFCRRAKTDKVMS